MFAPSSALRGTPIRSYATVAAASALVSLLAIAIGIAAALDPRLVVAMLVAGGLAVLVARRAVTILVPFALLVLAWDSTTLPGAGVSFQAKFLVLGIVAAMALPAFVSPTAGHPPVPRAFGVAFFVLVLFATASSVWSVDPSVSLQRGSSIALVWAAVVLAIPLSLHNDHQIRDIVRRNALLLGALTLLGLVLGLTGFVEAFESGGRFQGLMINPNTIGYFAAPILAPAVLLGAQLRAGHRRQTLILAIITIAVGIALSGSRAGALSSLVGIAVGLSLAGFFRHPDRQARRALLLLAGIVIVAIAAFPVLGLTPRGGGNGAEGYFEIGGGSGRELNWSNSFPLVAERSLLGHGFGATPALFPGVQSRTQEIVLGGSHNSYLEAAIDIGVVGALLLVVLAVSGLIAAVRLSRARGPSSSFGPLLAAGITAGLVEAFFETGMLAAGGVFAFPFWFCVALAHSLLVREHMENPRTQVGATS